MEINRSNTRSDTICIKDIPYGIPVDYNGTTIIKVTPVGFVKNSKMLSEIKERGDSLIVVLTTGAFSYIAGKSEVRELDYKFEVTEKWH